MSLDWSAKPAHRSGSALIGKVILLPGLEYTVELWGDMASSSHPHKEQYQVRLEAFGCGASKSFDTAQEAQAYIKSQQAIVDQFAKIKAKRDAIAKRINPLQCKWDACNQTIFELLGVR